MPSTILARADALMRRRRQSSSEPDDVPLLTDAIDPDTEIPVLLDAEPPVAVAEPRHETEPLAEPGIGAAIDEAMLDLIAHELSRRVHERLAAELPAIVETTIRDFLAEPEMLALLRSHD
jgi:hypothetical protein